MSAEDIQDITQVTDLGNDDLDRDIGDEV